MQSYPENPIKQLYVVLVQCNRSSIGLRVQHAECKVVRWPRIAVHEARCLLCLKTHSAVRPHFSAHCSQPRDSDLLVAFA